MSPFSIPSSVFYPDGVKSLTVCPSTWKGSFLSSAKTALNFPTCSFFFPGLQVLFDVCLGSGDMMSFLMTEARQHNTEIRMAVSKVADKMDHLMTKVTK